MPIFKAEEQHQANSCSWVIFSMRRTQTTYLALAISSLILALGLELLYENFTSPEFYAKQVRNKLLERVRLANQEALRDLSDFQPGQSPTFSNFLGSTQFPTFIAANDRLIFWSDNRFNIDHDDLAGYYRVELLSIDGGLFMCVQRTKYLDKEYKVYKIIPLRTELQEALPSHYRLNPKVFSEQEVEIFRDRSRGVPIFKKDVSQKNEEQIDKNDYLFSIEFAPDFFYKSEKKWVVVLLVTFSILFFAKALYLKVVEMVGQHREQQAFFLLLVSVLGIRALMLTSRFPGILVDSILFDPASYASSVVNPSLGDLLLNLLCINILAIFFLLNLRKIINLKWVFRSKRIIRDALSVVLVALTYLAALAVFLVLQSISINSPNILLDINIDFSFGYLKIAAILVFVMALLLYFMVCHSVSKLIFKLSPNLTDLTVIMAMGSLGYFVFSIMLELDYIWVFNVNAVYFAIITYFNFPLSLQKIENKTFIYLLICSVASSLIAALSIFVHYENRVEKAKQAISERIASVPIERVIQSKGNLAAFFEVKSEKEDPFERFYLIKSVAALQADDGLSADLDAPSPNYEEVSQKSMRFLSPYLKKITVEVVVLNARGKLVWPNAFQNEGPLLGPVMQATEKDGIFVLKSEGVPKGEVFVAEMVHQGRLVGYLGYFNFERERFANLGNKAAVGSDAQAFDFLRNFSYAVYKTEPVEEALTPKVSLDSEVQTGTAQLVYSYGDFNYDNTSLNLFKASSETKFLRRQAETGMHRHTLYTTPENEQIIISSTKYPLFHFYANFSFYFLILLFFTLCVVFTISYASKERRENVILSTRIQLYLNFAFFLPLIVVSVVAVSILSTGSQTETQSYFLEKAQNVNESVAPFFELPITPAMKDSLFQKVNEIAEISQTEIRVYDKQGGLLAYNANSIAQNELLNPQAFVGIYENNQTKMMLSESFKGISFNSAFVGIKPPFKGQTLGVVSIPFFQSDYRFERQVIEVITTIMSVFATMFLLLPFLSTPVVILLVRPLTMITEKLRRVSLTGKNETIEYHSHDEIGMLVGEYNLMLIKLEESRAALARNEKETAWREMAQQVAHEIKNPLTPMKLRLQQLERLMGQDAKSKKTLKVLLNQVETLNDITTSFSSFAKMPLPREIRFELSSLLKDIIALHKNNGDAVITSEIPEGEFYILGDPKLMGRVFTNLIVNGIQAVHNGHPPLIHVSLTPFSPNRILLEFKDNGQGIPEDIQKKVFIPKFTTKQQGSGFGLPISKRGIEHLGGNIWFETAVGEGTSFFIDMPLHQN